MAVSRRESIRSNPAAQATFGVAVRGHTFVPVCSTSTPDPYALVRAAFARAVADAG